MNKAIELKNVIRIEDDGRRSLNGVSLFIHASERVAICGPPGSGKGTLLRLIAGVERPSAGEVFMLGHAMHLMEEDAASRFRSETIGIVWKTPCLLQGLTMMENIALSLLIRGVPKTSRMHEAEERLDAMGLMRIANKKPPQVPYFEKKLVALARALMGKPEVLLLYEADYGLMQNEAEKLYALLEQSLENTGQTVVLFSEDAIKADRKIRLIHGVVGEELA